MGVWNEQAVPFDEQTVFNISSFIESKLPYKNMIAKESK